MTPTNSEPLNKSLESEIEALLKHYYLYMKQCEIAGDSKISHTAVKGAINRGNELHAQITNRILALIKSELKNQREDIRKQMTLATEQRQILVGWKKDMEHTPIHKDWQAVPLDQITKILDGDND